MTIRIVFGLGRAFASGPAPVFAGASNKDVRPDSVQSPGREASGSQKRSHAPQAPNYAHASQFGQPLRCQLLWGSIENFLDFVPPSDVHDLEIVIDGKPVAALEDGNPHYLHQFGADGFGDGEFPLVTAWNGWLIEYFGYEIAFILAPLPPGDHVIEMRGKSACCGGFESDVTYHLTVLPGRRK